MGERPGPRDLSPRRDAHCRLEQRAGHDRSGSRLFLRLVEHPRPDERRPRGLQARRGPRRRVARARTRQVDPKADRRGRGHTRSSCDRAFGIPTASPSGRETSDARSSGCSGWRATAHSITRRSRELSCARESPTTCDLSQGDRRGSRREHGDVPPRAARSGLPLSPRAAVRLSGPVADAAIRLPTRRRSLPRGRTRSRDTRRTRSSFSSRNARFREWSKAAQPDGFPDRIVWRLGVDEADQVSGILKGRSDLSFRELPPELLGRLASSHAGQVRFAPRDGTYFMSLNTRPPPFDDVRVRRALNFAVDRELVAKIFAGIGSSTCQVFPPNFPGYVPYCPFTRHPERNVDRSGSCLGTQARPCVGHRGLQRNGVGDARLRLRHPGSCGSLLRPCSTRTRIPRDAQGGGIEERLLCRHARPRPARPDRVRRLGERLPGRVGIHRSCPLVRRRKRAAAASSAIRSSSVASARRRASRSATWQPHTGSGPRSSTTSRTPHRGCRWCTALG